MLAFIWDTTDKKRKRWVKAQARRTGSHEFRLEVENLPAEFSFIVLGDTGEGDSSQIVLVDKFLKEAADTAFSIIASDVIYPAGRSHEYREKFYVPYRHYKRDIYAIPGNHDWYDELVGFMIHFCDNTYHFRDEKRKRPTVERERLDALRVIHQNKHFQPNMYFYIDTPHVRIVGIDTGIRGRIDDEQEAWLRRVSDDPKPKILISGKPIYVDGKYNDKLANVDRIVNAYNYKMVIAGDIHNFQRYRVPVTSNGAKHDVWHFVNGGGGASLNRTHKIPQPGDMPLPVKLGPGDFECYPTREQSEKYYSGWWKSHAPDWAVDRDQPPYHKSFMKISVEQAGIRAQVFVVEEFDEFWVNAPAHAEWMIPFA